MLGRLKTPCQALCAVVLLMAAALSARAHELTPAVADLFFEGSEARFEIEMNIEAALARIGPGHSDTDLSPQASAYAALRLLPAVELRSRVLDAPDALLWGFDIRLDGARAAPRIAALEVPSGVDPDLARFSRLTLLVPLAPGAKALTFGWDETFGEIVLRADAAGYAAFLGPAERSDPIPVTQEAAGGPVGAFLFSLRAGFAHVLPGRPDHALFAVALFLLSPATGLIMRQVAAFALGYVAGFALSAPGFASLPLSVSAALVAASVLFLGVANVFSARLSPWRLWSLGLFGVIHGLAIAGALAGSGGAGGLLQAAGFSLGAGLAIIVVIGLCWGGLGLWFGQKPWYRRAVIVPGSVFVALMGAYWLLVRAVFPVFGPGI